MSIRTMYDQLFVVSWVYVTITKSLPHRPPVYEGPGCVRVESTVTPNVDRTVAIFFQVRVFDLKLQKQNLYINETHCLVKESRVTTSIYLRTCARLKGEGGGGGQVKSWLKRHLYIYLSLSFKSP